MGETINWLSSTVRRLDKRIIELESAREPSRRTVRLEEHLPVLVPAIHVFNPEAVEFLPTKSPALHPTKVTEYFILEKLDRTIIEFHRSSKQMGGR